MATAVNDIWPRASGTASLGAEMRNGGFTGEIHPFAHIHANSGIFHDVHGASGVIRFSDDGTQYLTPRFELSLDGGDTFSFTIGENPNALGIQSRSIDKPLIITSPLEIGIASDGNASLAGSTGDVTVTAGVDINLIATRDSALFAGQNAFIGTQYGNTEIDAFQQISLLPFAASGALDYRFGPYQAWYWKASHSSTGGPFNDGYWPIPHSGNVLEMIVEGVIAGNIGITSIEDDAGNGTSNLVVQITTSNGVISEIVDAGTINIDALGRGVNGVTVTHPIEGLTLVNAAPLSGLLLQRTLQDAYNAGHVISTSLTEGGPVAITGTDQSALRIAVNEGQGAHIELSGVISAPTLFNYQGALLLAKHGYNLNDPFLTTATEASLKASSPGLSTLWMNMGASGITTVRVASGVAQFLNSTDSAAITDIPAFLSLVPISQINPDSFFLPISGSGIRFNVDGLYRVTYSLSTTKTAGTLSQQCNSELNINDQWGRRFLILGSVANTLVRNSSTLNKSTSNGQVLLDMNAGEVLNMRLKANSIPSAPDSMNIAASGASIIVEYIGPQRSVSTIRQVQ